MSIILNAIEKEEPIIHFEKIYPIIDELVVSQDSTNKLSLNKNIIITNKDDVDVGVGVIQYNVKRPSKSQITSPKIENMDRYSSRDTSRDTSRDSDLVTVDGINDPLIKNKNTYWNSLVCSFDCIYCCCVI